MLPIHKKIIDMNTPCDYNISVQMVTVFSTDGIFMNSKIIDNMISWAESRMGNTDYIGWCLSFIEDALEISNGIEIFGGDSAKESCEMYADALQSGIPEKGAFVFYDCLCPGENGLINYGHCGIALDDGSVIHAWDKVRKDGYLEIEKLTAVTGDHPKYIGWVPISRVLAQKDTEV